MSILEMRVPTIGESITEVTLSQWLKADGEYVNLDEPICEFESDKATLEFPAEAAGKIVHVAAEGDDLEIGALVAKIDTSVSQPVEAAGAPSPDKAKASASKSDSSVPTSSSNGAKEDSNPNTYASGHPSPSAAKILNEKGINPQSIIGSGKGGRITKEDALKAEAPAITSDMESKTPPSMVGSLFSRQTTKKKMSRMRRTIADRLVRAKNQTAMLTTFNEVDLTEVMALRKKYQEEFVEKYGIKLGFMSLFAKACANVLMDIPDVNAQIIDNQLIYHDYVDISIAISTPTGLVVPPVKNVESLHFADIEKEIKHLSNKARNGTLTIEEMQGGTFTITNGGVFGSLLSTPILNEPQSAILGMHSIKERPVAVDGKVEIRPMMYLALSYDHRVIDGSSSVTFLVRVKELLEDPAKMLLGI